MNKLKVIRKRNVFLDAETKKVIETHDSISIAKRRSRLMQSSGRWEVSVDRSSDPKPPKRSGKRMDAADRFIAEAVRKEQAERVAQEQERKRGPNTLSLRK